MSYGCQTARKEFRYQPDEICARRWRLCSLIHAAVTVAPYFAFHENVFVYPNRLPVGAGALRHLRARARDTQIARRKRATVRFACMYVSRAGLGYLGWSELRFRGERRHLCEAFQADPLHLRDQTSSRFIELPPIPFVQIDYAHKSPW